MWLSEPTLTSSLLLIEGGSCKKSEDVVREYGVKEFSESPAHARAWFYRVDADNHKKKFTFNILYWDGESVGDLAHEVSHLVMTIFDDRGIPIAIQNEEIFAYHVGYWMKVIMEKIKVTEV